MKRILWVEMTASYHFSPNPRLYNPMLMKIISLLSECTTMCVRTPKRTCGSRPPDPARVKGCRASTFSNSANKFALPDKVCLCDNIIMIGTSLMHQVLFHVHRGLCILLAKRY